MSYFFFKQGYHIMFLLIALPILLWFSLTLDRESLFLGYSIHYFYFASIIGVIIHQVLVWFVFRSELIYGLITKRFKDKALVYWAVLFMVLLALRPVLILIIALNTQETLIGIKILYQIIAIMMLVPALYTLYSVFRYFGIYRAIGGDHFLEKYREMPFVNKGMFKYSSNAMYTYAFLLLYVIAFVNMSLPAFVLALFQHGYIWVHYYTVEKPDMIKIYQGNYFKE